MTDAQRIIDLEEKLSKTLLELGERREEIDDLETELAAARTALAEETKAADHWAKQMHASNKLVTELYEVLRFHNLLLPQNLVEGVATIVTGAVVKGLPWKRNSYISGVVSK